MNNELPQQQHPKSPEASQQNYENIVDGIQRLAENITKAAETYDPTDAVNYLNYVLADTQEAAHPHELLATFYILYGQQQKADVTELLSLGDDMLAKLESSSAAALAELNASGDAASLHAQAMIRSHVQDVGPHLIGKKKADVRAGAKAQNTMVPAATEGIALIDTHMDSFRRWTETHQQTTGKYIGQYDQYQVNRQAIAEVRQIVDPSYDGDTQDVSLAFDESVKQEAAIRILSAIADAELNNVPPEKTLLELLRPRDKEALRTLAELYTLATQQHEISRDHYSKNDISAKSIKETLQEFIAKGNTYKGLHGDEAKNLYLEQNRRLGVVIDDTNLLAFKSTLALESSLNELRRHHTV